MDVLVSGNFEHVVHYEKMLAFNAVNPEMGHRELRILSPREVSHGRDEDA